MTAYGCLPPRARRAAWRAQGARHTSAPRACATGAPGAGHTWPAAGGETSGVSLTVVVLLTALLLGRAFGGSVDNLGRLHLRRRRLVVGALLAQVLGTVIGGPFYAVGLIVSTSLVIFFLSRNRRIAGTALVAAGLLANVLVVGANGAMPVSATAAGRAGVSVQDLLRGAGARHELAGAQTRLRWLGDVIPFPLPVRPEVLSPGDVLIAAGLAQLVTTGMLGAPRPPKPPRGAARPPSPLAEHVPRVMSAAPATPSRRPQPQPQPRPPPQPGSRPLLPHGSRPPRPPEPRPEPRPEPPSEPRPEPPPRPARPAAQPWTPPARWASWLLPLRWAPRAP